MVVKRALGLFQKEPDLKVKATMYFPREYDLLGRVQDLNERYMKNQNWVHHTLNDRFENREAFEYSSRSRISSVMTNSPNLSILVVNDTSDDTSQDTILDMLHLDLDVNERGRIQRNIVSCFVNVFHGFHNASLDQNRLYREQNGVSLPKSQREGFDSLPFYTIENYKNDIPTEISEVLL